MEPGLEIRNFCFRVNILTFKIQCCKIGQYEREAQTGQKTSEVSVQSRGHWTKQEWLGGGRNKTGTAAVRNTEGPFWASTARKASESKTRLVPFGLLSTRAYQKRRTKHFPNDHCCPFPARHCRDFLSSYVHPHDLPSRLFQADLASFVTARSHQLHYIPINSDVLLLDCGVCV